MPLDSRSRSLPATLAGDRDPGRDPDRDVLELAARGQAATALRQLMRRHGRAIYRYCRQALDDGALADDVHQQVFIQAHRDLERFAGRSTVRTWLFGIARHRVLDAIKARARAHDRRDEGADLAELSDPAPALGATLDDLRLRRALVASLAVLGERTRTALLLRYQQGFTYDEMAEICGERAGTLAARVARALPVLRALIEAQLASVDR